METPKGNVRTPIVKDKPLTSKLLKDQLAGTHEQRMQEEKTIFLAITPGNRPEVTFTGFWSARFIRAAMDSIAKAYRLRKSRVSRPIGDNNEKQPREVEGGKQ